MADLPAPPDRTVSKQPVRSELVPASDGLYYDRHRDMFVRKTSTTSIPRTPLSMCIAPIAKCNLRCRTCLSDSGPGGLSGEWPELRSVLEWMRPWAPVRLIWTGGEPTLYWGLADAIRMATSMGSNSVVCTNASTRDPCGELAGEFCYSVSIYGNSRATFLQETQRDHFSRFQENFDLLFRRNHKVVASIRVDQESKNRALSYATWLTAYPIRKLTILNTRQRGRLVRDGTPLTNEELSELGQQLAELSLPFPVVLPASNAPPDPRGGLIVVERPEKPDGIVVVNGTLCGSLAEARAIVDAAIPGNAALFASENYIRGLDV